MKTWHLEAIVFAIILTFTVMLTSPFNGWTWCLAAGIWFFSRVDSIIDRQLEQTTYRVKCFDQLKTMVLAGQSLTFIYCFFQDPLAWVALVGGVYRALYPIWRKLYRYFNPRKESCLN